MDTDSELGLRRSLGRFATGVTVVTCCAPDGRACGITANSFSSVSLDPPLVLWNIAKGSNSLDAYLAAEHFAIHVLNADQQYMAEHFARTDHTRYNGIEHEISGRNVPILPGVLARFDCRTQGDSRGRRSLHHRRGGRSAYGCRWLATAVFQRRISHFLTQRNVWPRDR